MSVKKNIVVRKNVVNFNIDAALQQQSKNKEEKSSDLIVHNTRYYVEDYERFKNLKKFLLNSNGITKYHMSNIFNDGLELLKEKLKYEEVSEDNVLNTSGGRRMGSLPFRMLSEDEQVKLLTKSTTVNLSYHVKKMYDDYKTYRIKQDDEISTADIFKEMLNIVEEKYKK